MGNFLSVFIVYMKASKCIANRPAGNLPTNRRIQTGGSLMCYGGQSGSATRKNSPHPYALLLLNGRLVRASDGLGLSQNLTLSTYSEIERCDNNSILEYCL
jgi:hypothetical protein